MGKNLNYMMAEQQDTSASSYSDDSAATNNSALAIASITFAANAIPEDSQATIFQGNKTFAPQQPAHTAQNATFYQEGYQPPKVYTNLQPPTQVFTFNEANTTFMPGHNGATNNNYAPGAANTTFAPGPAAPGAQLVQHQAQYQVFDAVCGTSDMNVTFRGQNMDLYEMPKASKKRRLTNNDSEAASTNSPLDPLLQIVVDPQMPDEAKIGVINAINALITSKKASPKALVREDFIDQIGGMMKKMLKTPDETLKSILNITSFLAADPESKQIIQNHFQDSLKKLSEAKSSVDLASNILSQLG